MSVRLLTGLPGEHLYPRACPLRPLTVARRRSNRAGFSSIMANLSYLTRRQGTIAVGLMAFALLSGAILIAKSRASVTRVDTVSLAGRETTAVPSSSTTPDKPPVRVEAERLVVRRHGFEPAEITRPHGRFLIALDNRSGTDDLDLQLAAEHGSESRRVSLSVGKTRWREILNLPPGSYLLTEAGHPQWQCRITITPR